MANELAVLKFHMKIDNLDERFLNGFTHKDAGDDEFKLLRYEMKNPGAPYITLVNNKEEFPIPAWFFNRAIPKPNPGEVVEDDYDEYPVEVKEAIRKNRNKWNKHFDSKFGELGMCGFAKESFGELFGDYVICGIQGRTNLKILYWDMAEKAFYTQPVRSLGMELFL